MWLVGGPGSLLHAVQESCVYLDSKQFVDMPLKRGVTPNSVSQAWDRYHVLHPTPLIVRPHSSLFVPCAPPRHQQQEQPRSTSESGHREHHDVKHDKDEAQPPVQGFQGSTAGQYSYRDHLIQFIDAHFDEPASDLVACTPPDWSEQLPGWISQLPDPQMVELGAEVHRLWKVLYRKASPRVHEQPDHHTLLPLPKPFVIPGDRFRECYNWDSFWIIRGLLASGLCTTAKDLVMNLLSLIDTVGHIPNGARTYYKNRSQPPLISAMVLAASGLSLGGNTPLHSSAISLKHQGALDRSTGPVNTETGGAVDVALLQFALPRLISTWQYWNRGAKVVCVQGAGAPGLVKGCLQARGAPVVTATLVENSQKQDHGHHHHHVLSKYHAEWQEPRPESYREDIETVRHAVETEANACKLAAAAPSQDAAAQPVGPHACQMWLDIASAAESGWDFSSRWLADGHNLHTIRTTQVIPADLNAFLYMLARDIATIAQTLGHASTATEYEGLAAQRLTSLQHLMWSEQDGCWHDLLMSPCAQPGSTDTLQQQAAEPLQQAGEQAQGGVSSYHPQCAEVQQSLSPSIQPGCSAQQQDYFGQCQPIVDTTQLQHVRRQQQQFVHSVEQLRSCAASNWVPLWAGCCQSDSSRAAAAAQGLRVSGLLQPGGVMTTSLNTGQQWDAPNAWPPLQHLIIEGLAHSGSQDLAQQIAGSWLTNNMAAYHSTGQMHEKYDALVPGQCGGGGEYTPQVGFGWTNGVLLDLLHLQYTL